MPRKYVRKLPPSDAPQRILSAAAEEMAAKGFAAVRIDEIARKADCNKQLIYYYFGNKEGLRNAVLSRMVDEAAPIWQDVAKADPPEALHRIFHPAASTIDWSRLLAWEGVEYGDPGTESDLVLEERRSQAYQVQVDMVRRAQEAGQIPAELDPAMLSVMVTLLAMSRSLVPHIIKLTTGLDAGSPEYAERLWDFTNELFTVLAAQQNGLT
ncbi:TetR/AcrR family transcriptional regulator [Streptomyces sp. NPDC046805]|uniref:TetR/AcrR family transcriptional regulator n=1 Tax=Streptomyces sp. NPDC046805 TaxID=3155134 RepID=UPI0033EA9F6E